MESAQVPAFPAHLPLFTRQASQDKNWCIEFVSGNRTIREATQFTKGSDAAEFLKQRVGDAMAGKIPLAKGVTYDDLAELIVNDYRDTGRKSMWSPEHVRLPKL